MSQSQYLMNTTPIIYADKYDVGGISRGNLHSATKISPVGSLD